MLEQQENVEEVLEVVAEQTTLTTTIGSSVDEFNELFSRVDTLESAKVAISLNMSGYEFKTDGEAVRGIFMGFTEITVKDPAVEGGLKKVPAIKWIGSDRQVKFNAGKNLVAQFVDQDVQPKTSVLITLEKQVPAKSGTGKVKVYKVDILAN